MDKGPFTCERAKYYLPKMIKALEAALDWIDAVPSDTPLPSMPGFDRDELDGLMSEVREVSVAFQSPEEKIVGQCHHPARPAAIEADRKRSGSPLVPPVWTSDQYGGKFDDLTSGQGYRLGWNDCRAAMLESAPTASRRPAIAGCGGCGEVSLAERSVQEINGRSCCLQG